MLGYFSNWHFIAGGTNYFAMSAAPSLLTHTWSLAIEEQFYLVWPLILMAILSLCRRHRDLGLRMVFGVSMGGAVLSTLWMARLYHSGASSTRLYYGTDTHAQSILVGCALAAVLTMIARRRQDDALVPVARSRRARWVLSGAGVAAAAALGWQWTHVDSGGHFADQGGFLVGALLTAIVLVSAASAPKGPLAVVLSWPVLTYLGTISYGMYLWYFPIFQVVDAARTHRTGFSLFAIRVAVDIAIATASYFLIEQPDTARRPVPHLRHRVGPPGQDAGPAGHLAGHHRRCGRGHDGRVVGVVRHSGVLGPVVPVADPAPGGHRRHPAAGRRGLDGTDPRERAPHRRRRVEHGHRRRGHHRLRPGHRATGPGARRGRRPRRPLRQHHTGERAVAGPTAGTRRQ